MEKEKKFSFFKKKEKENEKCNSSDDVIVYKGQEISLGDFAKTLLDEAVYHKDKPVNDESEKDNNIDDKEEVKEEKETIKENDSDSLNELESFLIEKGLDDNDLSKVSDLIINLYETINVNDEEDEVKENEEEVDKRKDIDDVGGFLKSKGLSDEDIRYVMKLMEKNSYNNEGEEDVKDEEPKKVEEEKKVEELKLNSLNPNEYSSFEKSYYKKYNTKNNIKTTDEIIDESTNNF